jgi:O-antigen ligase
VIGYGFGSTKESYFGEYTGRFYKTYSPRTNQLSSTLIEMGYPGLVFYFWLIFAAFAMNIRFFRNTKDNYWKAISFGLDGVIFMYFVGILYNNIWRAAYASFPFWFFLAIIYSLGRRKRILE